MKEIFNRNVLPEKFESWHQFKDVIEKDNGEIPKDLNLSLKFVIQSREEVGINISYEIDLAFMYFKLYEELQSLRADKQVVYNMISLVKGSEQYRFSSNESNEKIDSLLTKLWEVHKE